MSTYRCCALIAGLLAPLLVGASCVAQASSVGGEPVVVLHRAGTSGGHKLEFLSMTLFPGRAMNTFQITANLPGKGEIPLLLSPTLEEASSQLTGTGRDRFGNAIHSFGGAFLIPYGNIVTGPAADGDMLNTTWHGQTLRVPANWSGKLSSEFSAGLHGLILDRAASDLKTRDIPGGQEESATLHAGSFGDHWLSSTDLHFVFSLTGNAIDITVTAKNVGKVAEPMAIGWHPYFAIPSEQRAQTRLHLPAERVMDQVGPIPTGKLLPVAGTAEDFRAAGGAAVGSTDYNNNFSDFNRDARGISAAVIDPASNYGIRIDSLSPEMQTVQIYAPSKRNFIAVEPMFNFPDPFSKVWHGMDTGMVTLEPGKSVTWKVRLELFEPNSEK